MKHYPWTDKRKKFDCGFVRSKGIKDWWWAYIRVFALTIRVDCTPRWITKR